MELGQKIRRMRKLRKITQSELAGDRITRNMLSQIENGIASPSVQTMLYLAQRLDVPVGYFLSESDDDFVYRKMQFFDVIKAAYMNSDYRSCVDICEKNLSDADDEINQILSECNLRIGEEMFNIGAFVSSAKYFRKALSHCEKTIYNTGWIRARALMFLSITEDVDMPLYNLGNDFTDLADKSILLESYVYMKIMNLIETHKKDTANELYNCYKFNNPVYKAHINAKLMMSAGRYLSAAECLNNILFDNPKEDLNIFMKYKLYTDLESCCRETDDFEGAYKYSSKRLHLISEMKS